MVFISPKMILIFSLAEVKISRMEMEHLLTMKYLTLLIFETFSKQKINLHNHEATRRKNLFFHIKKFLGLEIHLFNTDVTICTTHVFCLQCLLRRHIVFWSKFDFPGSIDCAFNQSLLIFVRLPVFDQLLENILSLTHFLFALL